MHLKLRILLPILLLHVVVIPISVYRFLMRYEKPVWQAEIQLAEALLREIQNQLAIQQIVFEGRPGQLQETTRMLAKSHGFEGLSVYDAEGHLKAQTGKTLFPLNIPEKRNQAVLSGSIINATQWVKNDTPCHSCHGAERSYIGAIQASFSIAPLAAKLEQQRRKAMLTTFASLLGVFLLIYLFHYYFIIYPVKKILKGMETVKAGDLAVEIPVKHKDEIGMLAEGFNDVVKSLRIARTELENRHRQDMVRADQLATVGEIAAGLAHEVKNPVAGISSAMEVVVSEMDDSPNREILSQVIQETHRITSTINSLLDYARPKQPRPEWIDVDMLVSDIQTIFAPQCQQHRVSFEAHVAPEAGRIYVDVQSLKQILINVLRNSLEAVQSGATIRMDVQSDEESVQLTLSDNGPGMDDSTRARIFQPFYTTKPNGTGLGLAIVYRLVENMGGAISVRTAPGIGTSFEIHLPRMTHHEAAHC